MLFKVIEEKIEIDSKIYTVYGISVIFDNGEEKIFSDISFDLKTVSEFVSELNFHKPENVHMNDLIEDFFCR